MSENVFDKLYDENNNDNVILYNEQGDPVEFEQIAIIPYGEQVYIILHPVTQLDGVLEGEGLVFIIGNDDDGTEKLNLVVEEDIIDAVFSIYDRLVEEAEGNEQ